MIGKRYQIVKEIGLGGIARVCQAIDLFERKTVAIKILSSREPEDIERFKKEFLLLRKLHHPNIVKVYDFGFTESGESYFTMEHIEGSNWQTFLQPLDYSKFWHLLMHTCSTLDFIHSQGIIHGDLKPSNILIANPPDGRPILKFTDFGFAECGQAENRIWWKGTLPYIAPEIIRGEKHNHQSDLYSLGVLIFETIFGRKPFNDENIEDLARSHLEKEVLIPQEPAIPADLKNIILKLLEKDPIDRFFSANEVLSEVEKVSGLKMHNFDTVLAQSLIASCELVGRTEELSVLKEALHKTTAGKGAVVLISGESGVGKTRLLEEFKAQAQTEGALVVEAGLATAESGEVFQKKTLRFLIHALYPSVLIWKHIEPADDHALGLLEELIRQTQNKKILFCLTETNALAYSDKDPKAYEVEERIKSRKPDSFIEIKLSNFTESETGALFCSMFQWGNREKEIAAAIHTKTNGNPLLIKQLMNSLADDNQIRRLDGFWSVELEQIIRSHIPIPLANDITSHLSRLGQEEWGLLAIASVLGWGFQMESLREISGMSPESFSKHLNHILAERIWLRSVPSGDKDELSFVNGFTRDYIYQKIDLPEKGKLHEKVGNFLEKKYAEELKDHADQLADHFYQAADDDRALRYLLLAAGESEKAGNSTQVIKQYLRVLELYDRRSISPVQSKQEILEALAQQYETEGDYTPSLHYYQNALELRKTVNPDDHKIIEIYRRMARIFGMSGKPEKSRELLDRAMSLLSPGELPGQRAALLIDLAWDYSNRCEYDQAAQCLKQAIATLEGQPLSKELGNALYCMGQVHWLMGHYPEAIENLHKSLEVFESLKKTESTVECHITLGLVKRSEGFPTEALEYFQKGLEVMQSFHDPHKLSKLENNLSLVYMDINRWDEALECLSRSVELKKRLSDIKGLGISYNNMGLVYLRKGLFHKSLNQFSTALQLFREVRDRSGVALIYHNLGDLYRYRQEWVKASHYLSRSLKIARELGEESRMADCLFILGELAIQQGDFDLSMRNLSQALELFTKDQNRLGQAEARLGLAQAALAMNNFEEAQGHLDQVGPLAESLGNKWMVGRFKRVHAHFLKTRGEKDISLEYLLESTVIFKELGARYELAEAYLELGKIKLEAGKTKEGKVLLHEALGIFEKSEVKGKEKEVKALLSQIAKIQPLEKEKIRTFYKLADLLSSIWDTDELLSKTLELVVDLLNAERGAILFYSDKDRTFEVKVSMGLEPETSEDAVAISRKVLTDVIKSDSPLIVANAQESPQFTASKSVVMYNILSILCVPLKTKNRLIGTVYLDHRSLPAVFSSEDVDFLKAFASLIATAIEKSELYVKVNEEIFQLKESLGSFYQYPHIMGRSPKMQEIFNLVEKVADSKTSVLVYGESGTGKELIAHLIHTRSSRRDGPFLRVNCAALPESLLESELFGIEEKAATGVGFRKGKFELADGGTIFLDEVGDMSMLVQAKVLRVLQEKEFERVGGQRTIKVDIRVISATNMNLQKKVEEGTFRKDLFYRLNPIVIIIPPLRERKEDLPHLVQYFIKKFAEENNKPELKFTKKLISSLQNHSWPGNVRELEHLMESATLLSENGKFPKELLLGEFEREKEIVNLDKYGKLQEVLNWVEKKKIIQALEKNRWNQVKAAEELGLNEATLRRHIKKHKIRKTTRVSLP